MIKEFASVVKSIQKAFDRPEFYGEFSKGKLKNNQSSQILINSIEDLKHLSKQYPDSPEIPFLIGILSRYLGDQSLFQEKIKQAYEIDPEFLEAKIALREKEKYLDPFCYLNIEDLMNNPNLLRPTSSILLNINDARIDQVRNGINIKPVFIIKFERSKYRRLPTNNMDMQLALEICAVLPSSHGIPKNWQGWPIGNKALFTQAIKPFLDVLAGKDDFTMLMAICPVLADDPDDPFFKVIYVNLFPVQLEVYPPDYQPFLGRYESLRLCNPPFKTVFVFLDENNIPLLVKEIDLTEHKNELIKIRNIINLLPEEAISLLKWRRAVDAHDNCFFYRVRGREGKIYSIPKYRTGQEKDNVIFGLTVRNGEVRAKRNQEAIKKRDIKYDLFISHSHDDQAAAYRLTQWLMKIWPEIRLFMTSREQWEIDEMVPGYYFLNVMASKGVLFLATPKSIKSSHVLMELGLAEQLGLKIIVLCHGNSEVEKIEEEGLKGYFETIINLSAKNAEKKLLEAISSITGLSIFEDSQTGLLHKIFE